MACLYKVKWSSHLQSLMRACRVVHFNSPCNSRLSLFKAEYAVIKDPFVFQCVVHALGKCIVKRITVLCHANADAIFLEKSHISFGSILTPSVRVMNQSFGVYGMLLIETHCSSECSQRPVGIQRAWHAVSQNASVIGICNQWEIGKAFFTIYICDVGHHQLPTWCNRKFRNRIKQVRINVVMMTRICCSRPIASFAQHHVVGTQYMIEQISSNRKLLSEVLAAKRHQFPTTRLWEIFRIPYKFTIQNNAWY